jgi:Mce-associated membrane protein
MANSPTWYELLGVAHDASAEEIKSAWRDATDKFEPGSGTGQFRLFNEAADVLLDPAKRAAYDAELADVETDATPDVAPFETVAAQPPQEPPVETDATPDVELVETDPTPEADPTTPSFLERLGGSLGWVALICAPVVIAAIVITALVRHSYNDKVDTWQAGREASAAASRALTAVLSYDYQHMPADQQRALQFLTPAYGKTFSKTFALLTTGADGSVGPAVKTKTVVTADVLDTGVQDATTNQVDVVVFVNQTSQKPDKSPAIFQNRVVVTMVHRNGAWLIDNIKTY